MKAFGRRPEGARLERMRASPLWTGEGFRNRHPIAPGLRDASAPRPTISDFPSLPVPFGVVSSDLGLQALTDRSVPGVRHHRPTAAACAAIEHTPVRTRVRGKTSTS
jgi:hypothetical protein